MPNISLPTGKVIYLSVYEWLFMIEDKDIDLFFQSCIADDLGTFEDNPFSHKANPGKLEIDEETEIEETKVEEQYE